jgi:catalase
VNQPLSPVHSYNKDGPMRYHHSGNQPVYAPNSYGGPAADPERYRDPSYQLTGEILRSAYTLHREDDDFGQPGTLYREVLSEIDREHLAANIVGHARQGLDPDVMARVIEYWRRVDGDLGARVAKGMGT